MKGSGGGTLRRGSIVLVTGILSGLLLGWNTVAWRGGDLGHLREARRFWEDLFIAETAFQGAEGERFSIESGEGAAMRHSFERYVPVEVDRDGFKSWEFWRTLKVKPIFLWARIEPRIGDDPGRQEILLAGFRLLGGCAPLLPIWLGAFLGLPLLAWCSWELARAGWVPAAVFFPLLLSSSPYFVEMLSLPYSAAGFYLLALLCLVPLALFVFGGARYTLGALATRVAGSGIVFGLCVVCRAGTVLLAPAFLIAIAIAARRVLPKAATHRAAAGLALLLLFAGPYLLVRGREHRRPWIGIWEGFGDFDTAQGHEFYDPIARQALVRTGVDLEYAPGVGMENPETDAVFRRLVLHDVESSPLWYLKILAKRTAAVVTQYRLWRPAADEPRPRPSDTEAKVYYAMTTTAEWVGIGRSRFRVPPWLLGLPALWLLLSAIFPSSENARRSASVLGVVAIGALAMPVLVSTASALEAEAFTLVFFLGAALALGKWPVLESGESPPSRESRESRGNP